MQIIPLAAVPSQVFSVQLNAQSCNIKVYQKAYPSPQGGVYCDLYLNNALVIGGVLCENLNRIVRSLYLGFSGDLAFQDTQGSSDPTYTGLGTRFVFMYLEPSDLPAGEG